MCHDWHIGLRGRPVPIGWKSESGAGARVATGRTMRKRSFYGVLSGIVSTVIAGAAGSVACGASTTTVDGDGGSHAPPLPDESTFTCSTPLGEVIATLRPGSPVDYVELRGQHFTSSTNEPPRDGDAGALEDSDAGDAGSLPDLLPTETLSSHGTPCATASDRDACMSALADARIDSGGWSRNRGNGDMVIPPTYRHDFLVFTRGDDVGIAKNAAELAAFLGPIDTLEEARLLVTTQLHDLECATTPFKSGWRQNADGSWELLVTGRSCGTDYQVRMKVTADGVVSQVERRTLDSGAAPTGSSPRMSAAPRSRSRLGSPRRLISKQRASSRSGGSSASSSRSARRESSSPPRGDRGPTRSAMRGRWASSLIASAALPRRSTS